MYHSKCIEEGNVLFNDALNTFYLRLYGVGKFIEFFLACRIFDHVYHGLWPYLRMLDSIICIGNLKNQE